MPPVQQFRVREKLLRILRTAGAKEKLFTTRQIVTYLGKYIEKKKLHDSRNMRIVRCKGDFLEELFGVQEFAIESFNDMWQFIFPHIIPATNKEVLEHESQCLNKEKDSLCVNDSAAGKIDHQWMSQLPWWFFVEKEANGDENHDVATASGSIVAPSTVFVVDTDYESDSNDSRGARRDSFEEDRFSVEYEPDSDDSTDSDATEPFISDDESTFTPAPLPTSDYSEDTTTTDTTDVSMDFDIPLEDHWKCLVCKTTNSPTVGYCQRCWKLRKGWVDGPLSSQGLEKSQTLPVIEFTESFMPLLSRSSSQPIQSRGIDVTDGKVNTRYDGKDTTLMGSSSNFNELPFNNSTKRKHDSVEDSNASPSAKRKLSNENAVAGPSTALKTVDPGTPRSPTSPSVLTSSSESVIVREEFSSSSSSARTQQHAFPGLCNICHNNPNDATIVHGNVGHQFCCCRCAKKLKKKGKTCPVCRQPIAFVVKTYFYQMSY